ncbi:MAG TPA: exopolysaccharide synthesis protein exod [Cyanobacteria bacterium UBA8553]|nr:exopolysaccharide synthesis protein exod [Cyanobacteria bacterium UBA8553]HAJ61673.1 exopolysaccharide synthesis protein exod [Cyanobacteria bacterium UBA8543]
MHSTEKHPQTPRLQTSKLLSHFLQRHQGDEIRLRDLLHSMGDRAFGPVLLICALPEALPLPVAGASTIIGIPLMLISAQLVIGFRQPWLPRWIVDRPLKRQLFEQLIYKALRYLKKLERILKPRWRLLTKPTSERLIGLLLLILAIVIALPIPFGNILPAIAIVLISLGMIERDGLMIAISSIGAFVILALMAGMIVAIARVPLTSSLISLIESNTFAIAL